MNKWKWLYPGIGVKRWILLSLFGFILFSSGLAIITDIHFVGFLKKAIYLLDQFFVGHKSGILNWIFAFLILIMGFLITLFSFNKIEERVNQELLSEEELVDVLYERKQLEKGPEIVSLGGGTGLSNLLRGFKKCTSNITAIVTVADDGGSSGKLRDELGILPPGDIRNCLVALADVEPLMEKLMQYRFSDEGHLVGHSFGNLFIAAMTEVTGDFEEAIKESSEVLALKGQVLPATNEDVQLGAVYADNSIRMGESVIPKQDKEIKKVFLKPSSCKPTEDALKSIKQAGVITIGPGSLYTSILPNLLVEGIVEAIQDSNAIKVYICNVMTQPGETTNYTASDHIQTIYDHIGKEIFDYVIINTERGTKSLIDKYREEGAYPVKFDRDKIKAKQIKIIEGNLLSSNKYLRHDPDETAKKILDLLG